LVNPAEIAVLPLLLAATPLPVGSTVPFLEPAPIRQELPLGFGEQIQVETFDPIARAVVLAQQIPRQWDGTYQAFTGQTPLKVRLSLSSAIPLGQMVDVRGSMTVGDSTVPIQGNLNAKSDQLDLLLLGGITAAGLENGGEFRGLQGFSLSGWRSSRLTHPGGLLVLTASAAQASAKVTAPVRGLW
jgi:hypothetical protein